MKPNDFFQKPPQLRNQYHQDLLLQKILKKKLPPDLLRLVEPDLIQVGEDASRKLLEWSHEAETQLPQHIPYDPWGRRIDHIEMSRGWNRLVDYSATQGLVASAYEKKYGEFSRLYQMAMIYLFHPSSAFVSCPLAMTDGAARLIEVYSDQKLRARAYGHLTSRSPKDFWTSGQWMTERAGGSDVSAATATIARPTGEGFALFGSKWFTSAVTANMAMTLARIEGAEAGSRNLSLFYLELKNAEGQFNHIEVLRLKDKLGTKALPTAELNLNGTYATLVGHPGDGVKKIATLFNITRIYNAFCSVAQMRRALALATDFAAHRIVFGRKLNEQPLFKVTMEELNSQFFGCLNLVFELAYLQGREETGKATSDEVALLRLLTPVAKLYTGKLAVQVVSEVVEIFAGAGYCEDTGIPKLLRDAQVFPIWEGPTNVLSLDVLRAMNKECPFEVFSEFIKAKLQSPPESKGKEKVQRDFAALSELADQIKQGDADFSQSIARKFSFALAQVLIDVLVFSTRALGEESKGRRL